MPELLFVDGSGTIGVIQNDLSINSPGSVDDEVHRFVEEADTIYECESEPSLDSLHPELMLDLYCQTDVTLIHVLPPPDRNT